MEHNPFISFEDGLEITYSDLKKTSALLKILGSNG